MVLEVFIKFFGVKITIGLSKNHCDLILTVGFDFDSNLIVGSSYIHWKSIQTVRSSFIIYSLEINLNRLIKLQI